MTNSTPDLSPDIFRPRQTLSPHEISEIYSVPRKYRGISLVPLPSGRVAIYCSQGALVGIWDTPKEDFDTINTLSDFQEAGLRATEQLYYDAIHGGEPSQSVLARDLVNARREPRPKTVQPDLALDL